MQCRLRPMHVGCQERKRRQTKAAFSGMPPDVLTQWPSFRLPPSSPNPQTPGSEQLSCS